MARSQRGGELPHLDEKGAARMVDVGEKPATKRTAIAEAFVSMKAGTLRLLQSAALQKGDALAVARIAGISAAKKTADLIPLAHPLALTHVRVDVEPAKAGVRIEAEVHTTGPTGVEMEALTAASVAALSIYDMAKKHDRAMVIERVQLLLKEGGRSGRYERRRRSR
jgi:cyclic pyranopterin phosphate synthase